MVSESLKKVRKEHKLTQQEVADKLSISRSYISRLEKKSLETLKKYVKPSDFR